MESSELILNADGSIYHLGLLPEQVAPTVITVGDPERVPKVSAYFDRVDYRVQRREFVTHGGTLAGQSVMVISTGIGTDNIDIVLNELDALVNIDLGERCIKTQHTALKIIRLGTTGSLQAEVPTDSWLVSRTAVGMDGLLQFYDAPAMHEHPFLTALRAHTGEAWAFPVAPYFAEGSPALLTRFEGDFLPVVTATNSGFYGPQGRQLRAPVRQRAYLDVLQSFAYQGQRITNLEMETAGIYGLAQLLGHEAISLSVVLANRASGTFSTDPETSVRRMIEAALGRVI